MSPAPVAFEFTDGVTTLTNFNSVFYGFFGTSSSGDITSWVFEIVDTIDLPLQERLTVGSATQTPVPPGLTAYGYSFTVLQFATGPVTGEASTLGFGEMAPDTDAGGQAGSWSGPVSAPEPSTLMLFGSGLLVLVGLSQKQKAKCRLGRIRA
jgi:hypothetical protein